MDKLNNYNGSIDLISGLRPKNNGNFPLMEAHDVQVDENGTRLDEALQNIGGKAIVDVDELPSLGGYTLFNGQKNCIIVEGMTIPFKIINVENLQSITSPEVFMDEANMTMTAYCLSTPIEVTFEMAQHLLGLDDSVTKEEVETQLGVTFPFNTHYFMYDSGLIAPDPYTYIPSLFAFADLAGGGLLCAEVADASLATVANTLYLIAPTKAEFDKDVFYRVKGETVLAPVAIRQGLQFKAIVVNTYNDLPQQSSEESIYYTIQGLDVNENLVDQHWFVWAQAEEELDPSGYVPLKAAMEAAGMEVEEISDPSLAVSPNVIYLYVGTKQVEAKLYYFIDDSFKEVGANSGNDVVKFSWADDSMGLTVAQLKEIAELHADGKQIIVSLVVKGTDASVEISGSVVTSHYLTTSLGYQIFVAIGMDDMFHQYEFPMIEYRAGNIEDVSTIIEPIDVDKRISTGKGQLVREIYISENFSGRVFATREWAADIGGKKDLVFEQVSDVTKYRPSLLLSDVDCVMSFVSLGSNIAIDATQYMAAEKYYRVKANQIVFNCGGAKVYPLSQAPDAPWIDEVESASNSGVSQYNLSTVLERGEITTLNAEDTQAFASLITANTGKYLKDFQNIGVLISGEEGEGYQAYVGVINNPIFANEQLVGFQLIYQGTFNILYLNVDLATQTITAEFKTGNADWIESLLPVYEGENEGGTSGSGGGGLTKTKVTLAELQALCTDINNIGVVVTLIPKSAMGLELFALMGGHCVTCLMQDSETTLFLTLQVYAQPLDKLVQFNILNNETQIKVGDDDYSTELTDTNFDFYIYK